MRGKNWDYRELRERIADGLTLRQFTDFYCDPPRMMLLTAASIG
jgi:IS5 family transposase